MLFTVSSKHVKEFLAESNTWEYLTHERFFDDVVSSTRFYEKLIKIDTSFKWFEFDFINELVEYIDSLDEKNRFNNDFNELKYKSLKSKLKSYIKQRDSFSIEETKYKSLKDLAEGVKIYVENTFADNADTAGLFKLVDETQAEYETENIYLMANVNYHKKSSADSTEYVSFMFKNNFFGASSKTIYLDTIPNRKVGVSIPQILSLLGIIQIDNFDLENYKKMESMLYEVSSSKKTYNIKGVNKIEYFSKDRYGDRDKRRKDVDFDTFDNSCGVVDWFMYQTESDSSKPNDYLTKKYDNPYGLNDFKQIIPFSPMVPTFIFDKHTWGLIHVENLTEHIFKGEQFMENLVIPNEEKNLIKMLIQNNKLEMDDIISGKIGGSFVMSIGRAGVGKTLTAEIVAEALHLPIYKVQCSQLGVDVGSIEANLTTVLDRSARWNALLLIDEADVYVRSRGTDIQHNAIVGVFLRIMEYSKNITFMTTNINDIDDAILSRATAIINYTYPSGDNRYNIFKILVGTMNICFDENENGDDFKKYFNQNELSGRDIKSSLKLVKMYKKNNNSENIPILVSDFDFVQKYIVNKPLDHQRCIEHLD